MDDQRQPWDRLPNETSKHYTAFLGWRDLPPEERKIEYAYALYRKLPVAKKHPSGSYCEWFTKNRWVERANAWDDHLTRTRENSVIKAVSEAGADWVTRQEEHRERVFSQSLTILDKCSKLLKMDLEGGKLTPWAMQAIATTMSTADRMIRLAAGLETDRKATEISGPAGGPVETKNTPRLDLLLLSPDDLSDEDLDAACLTISTHAAVQRAKPGLRDSQGEEPAAPGGAVAGAEGQVSPG